MKCSSSLNHAVVKPTYTSPPCVEPAYTGSCPTYRLPSAYRWYNVPTKRPEAKQAHAPEIFAIPAEDLREDKKSSQYLPSWDFRLFHTL
eukprot:scaffold17311_cov131-Isochrysis_galbana.AAC.2